MESEELQAMAAESDLELAYTLQMQEALNASLSSSSSAAAAAAAVPLPPFRNGGVSDPAFADDFAQEIARLEQESIDAEMAQAEMRAMREDLNRRIHDQVFAHEMSSIPEEEWAKTGDHFNKPYGEGTSSAAEAYRLYFKGLVREEMVGGVKRMLAGIGIAICDSRDVLVFEMRKPLVSGVLSSDFAAVKAVIEGLNAVLTLGIKRVNILCDNSLLHQYGARKKKHLIGEAKKIIRIYLLILLLES